MISSKFVTIHLRDEMCQITVEHPQFITTQLEDGWIYEYKSGNVSGQKNSGKPETASRMWVDKDYTKVRITEGEGREYLLRLAVECRLIRMGYISLHGACVVGPDGEAIIFTGKSGIGKSTRAAAWKTALNLKMISGDRPLIWTGAGKCNTKPANSGMDGAQGRELQPTAYGVPWDGKEGIHVDLNAPISVIFNVIRAEKDECRIVEMNESEAVKVLMAQTFLPMWDTDLAATAMGNLMTLVKSDVNIASLVSGWDETAAIKAWEETKRVLSNMDRKCADEGRRDEEISVCDGDCGGDSDDERLCVRRRVEVIGGQVVLRPGK